MSAYEAEKVLHLRPPYRGLLIYDIFSNGYRIMLLFLSLPDEETAIFRVTDRIRQGGHAIPEDVIRRRFHQGLDYFQNRYKNVVDYWAKIDNSSKTPKLLEWGQLYET